MPVGPWEILIIAFVVLLCFGARRLPEIGRSLGLGMREFKDGISSPGEDRLARERELEGKRSDARERVSS